MLSESIHGKGREGLRTYHPSQVGLLILPFQSSPSNVAWLRVRRPSITAWASSSQFWWSMWRRISATRENVRVQGGKSGMGEVYVQGMPVRWPTHCTLPPTAPGAGVDTDP